MNDGMTYQAVRIGDVADWRLICEISANGVYACLKHLNPTQDIVTLFEERWDENAGDLLNKIENAVYDHPQVLDDFSADVTIVASNAIWVPTCLIEEDDEAASRLYNQVYTARECDVMSETVKDATCLYSLVPGLNAFLQRTFPGARIHSHLAVMAARFRERSSDVPRIYAEIRDKKVDILAFDRRNLLMAATHEWHEPNDIQYHIYNIMNVYDLDPKEVQVSLSGLRDVKNQLLPELRKNITYVMMTMLPTVGSVANVSTNIALLMRN